MVRKIAGPGEPNGAKPELCRSRSLLDMYVRRFAAFGRVEKQLVRANIGDARHSIHFSTVVYLMVGE